MSNREVSDLNRIRLKSQRGFKVFTWVVALTVTVLVLSNILVYKLIPLGPFVTTGAIILFPLAYVLSDITVEVYGYEKTREVIWITIFTQVVMVVAFMLVSRLPSLYPETAENLHKVIAQTPRIVIASMCGLWAGKFANAISLSWLKVLTKKKFLWVRTIGSSIPGQIADSGVFFTLAFVGLVPHNVVLQLVYTGVLTKLAYEILATPLTYAAVGWLKKKEEIDPLDIGVNYNPFKL